MIVRTIYYIDVGTLPKDKAEAYVKEMMERYKGKTTPIEEQVFLPVRDGGAGTRVEQMIVPESSWEAMQMVTPAAPAPTPAPAVIYNPPNFYTGNVPVVPLGTVTAVKGDKG